MNQNYGYGNPNPYGNQPGAYVYNILIRTTVAMVISMIPMPSQGIISHTEQVRPTITTDKEDMATETTTIRTAMIAWPAWLAVNAVCSASNASAAA